MKTLWLRRYKGRKPLPVLLDDEDYETASQYTWWRNGSGYIVGRIDGKDIYLHRFVMDSPDGLVIDHINDDRLDNRRCNLRVCQIKENLRNAGKRINTTSGHPGVSFYKGHNRYRAYIMVDRKQINLGCYQTIDEAIKARKRGEKKYFGEFAYSGEGD